MKFMRIIRKEVPRIFPFKLFKPYNQKVFSRKLNKEYIMSEKIRSTTILGIVHNGIAALGGDGQVSIGNTIMKHNAMKIRKISDGKVICGFAGGAADAFTLMERFEDKLAAISWKR